MKINLSHIKPGVMVEHPANDIGELLKHFLSLIQFVPIVRFTIGWRGMVPSTRYHHCWTLKIKGFQGVFGLCLANTEINNHWSQATFRVCYFPDPDESLVERFSMAAVYYTQQDNYREHCREFLDYPEMAALFDVGNILLAINDAESAIVLSVQAPSRHKITSKDGIVNPTSATTEYLLAPDELDQNLPSFVIVYGLFKVIAATATFSLQQSPSQLIRERHMGHSYCFGVDGLKRQPTHFVDDLTLSLGYGEISMTDFSHNFNLDTPIKSSLQWQEGQPYPSIMRDVFWWNAHKINDLKAYDKRMMGIEERPPLYVISGFLGSGKTSFLQHYLEHEVQRGRFVAVLQNEMGQVSLDGKLMDQSYSITELNEGTVCCSLAGELRTALGQIISRFQPDVIVLETSGATNPLYLREDLVPLSEIVRFDSVTIVVDAGQYRAIEQYDVIADQIHAADIIIVNKIDKVSEAILQGIMTDLTKRNPHAKIYPTTQGYVNPRVIFSDGSETSVKTRVDNQHSEEPNMPRKHHHDQLTSIKIPFDRAVRRGDLIDVLDTLPSNVFRLKGIVTLESERPVLVQYVAGDYQINDFDSSMLEEQFLVAIGHDLTQVQLQLTQLAVV
ncbi:CobW family GTP-binding protein [Shewanella algicola]|uniref:CobW family GTP-binding protein n=1 Tax=Shewanella algicola TaxID=640633 RepID=UPI0024956F82|nr:GTP-binding protein [Shewanella algicola]